MSYDFAYHFSVLYFFEFVCYVVVSEVVESDACD